MLGAGGTVGSEGGTVGLSVWLPRPGPTSVGPRRQIDGIRRLRLPPEQCATGPENSWEPERSGNEAIRWTIAIADVLVSF